MEDENQNNKDRFSITELILVKADWDRTYMGTIVRDKVNGLPILRGKVKVEEGKIIAIGNSDEKLYEALDTICILKLDYGLHGRVSPVFRRGNGVVHLN